MARQKIEIKRIEKATARQVTFSKRRRGLFKKAQELSTLCDAELAVIIFSANGKLFEYSSSSMDQVMERFALHDEEKLNIIAHPSLELQLETSTYAVLGKEIAEKTHELRQLKGEELQGLNIEELKRLQKSLEESLHRVLETKNDMMTKEINALIRKGARLKEENEQLKQKLGIDFLPETHEQHRLLKSTRGRDLSLVNDLQDNGASDICLSLGCVFP